VVNWGGSASSIRNGNHPSLFFYLIALVMHFIGSSEIVMHLFISIFTFAALFFFSKSIDQLKFKKGNLLLVLFGFSPALIINQNVLIDVPLLALCLGALFFLLKAVDNGSTKNFMCATLFITLGFFMKYSIAPAFVVLLAILVLHKAYRQSIVLIIPILLIGLWSYLSWLYYGDIKINSGSTFGIHIMDFWSLMLVLGAISPFTILIIYGLSPSKLMAGLLVGGVGLIVAIGVLSMLEILSERALNEVLSYLFVGIGMLLGIGLTFLLYSKIKSQARKFLISKQLVVLLFLVGFGIFFLLFAPFMATRHALLIIPFLILFGADLIVKTSKFLQIFTLVLSIGLGLILGLADKNYADFYRVKANEIEVGTNEKIWTTGHWGWQWYAREAGFSQYDTKNSVVEINEMFVFPGNVHREKVESIFNLLLVDKVWEEPDWKTFISVHNGASLYQSSLKNPTWSFSLNPIDTIYVYKVLGMNQGKIKD
jgi:hypothetical protein